MIDSHFLHRCTIQRALRTTDAYDNAVETWQDVESNVPCRLVEKTMRTEKSELAENMILKAPLLLVGAGADLQERDRIAGVTFEDGTVTTSVYVVTALLNRRSTALHHKSALLEVVQ